MQVSQMSDSVTHAVLGKQDSIEMGVSDSAALMHIFSTTLYTYPMLATVREIICNGWDGHITSGRTDTPLQITVSDEQIVIRDFGPGIPHAKIGPIYGVFGNSTKREDGAVTGGFGLGSKAPFSYTDNFEVVSNHEGLKSVYRVSKSSMERGGKPSIDTMVQVPTDETGIRVTIPFKFRFKLSLETEVLVTFFEDDSHYGSRRKLPKCLALSEKIPVSKMVQKLRDVIKRSEWEKYVCMDSVGMALKQKAPGDAKLAVPYEIVRQLMKEGLPQ